MLIALKQFLKYVEIYRNIKWSRKKSNKFLSMAHTISSLSSRYHRRLPLVLFLFGKSKRNVALHLQSGRKTEF